MANIRYRISSTPTIPTENEVLTQGLTSLQIDANFRSLDVAKVERVGEETITGSLTVDNIKLDANTISSADTNGNIIIEPNGTGDVQVNTDTVRIGDNGATAGSIVNFTTNGLNDLLITTNSNTSSGNIRIFDGASGNIELQVNGSGTVVVNEAAGTADFRVEGNADQNLLFVDGSANSVGIGISLPQNKLHVQQSSATTNAVTRTLRLDSQSTGTPASGIGVGMEFAVETAVGNTEVGAAIEAVTTDVTTTSEDFDIVFRTMIAGAAAAQVGKLNNSTLQVGAANTNTTITTQTTSDLTLNTNAGTNSGFITIFDGQNQNIEIQPNGTGDVLLTADTVRVGDANTNATITTNGTGDLTLNTNSGTASGYITIFDAADSDITIEPNGVGNVNLITDTVRLGSTNENSTITTDGTADLTLNTNSGSNTGFITIFDGANANIEVQPNGTGDVLLTADTVRVGDSGSNATITTNGAGDLILNTNGGTNSGVITILDAVDQNITIEPNGAGNVVLYTDTVELGGSTAAPTTAENVVVTTRNASDLTLSTNNGSNSGVIKIFDGASQNIELQVNGTGTVVVNEAAGTADFRVEGNADQNLLFADGSANNVAVGTNAPQTKFHIQQTTATTNAVTDVFRIDSQSSGTPAVGIGVGMEFAVETAAGNTEVGATIEAITTDVTAASEDFDLVFRTMIAGAAAAQVGKLNNTTLQVGANGVNTTVTTQGTADLTLNTNAGTNSGLIKIFDGVNGNIELQVNGTGTVVVNEAAGTADFRVEGNADQNVLFVDGSANSVGVGTNAPTNKLHVLQSSATTSAPTNVLRLDSQSTGIPASGIGVGMEFAVETTAGNTEVGATIEAIATDVTATSEDFDIIFRTMIAGAAAAQVGKLNNTTLQVGADNTNTTITTQGTSDLLLSTNNTSNSGIITIFDGANSNIEIAPNGTGDVHLTADTVRVGDANADATITTNGTGDLILNTNAGTNSGVITIFDAANGNIKLDPNGTGLVSITKNLDVDLDVNIDGGDLTTNQASFNLINTNATTLNIGSAATAARLGATSGTLTLGNPTVVGTQATQNLWNTVATAVNAFKAATSIDIGATTGTTSINHNLDVDLDVNIDGGDLTTSLTSFNVFNTSATTINAFGAATAIDIGATSGTTSINNNLDVDLDVNIDGGDLTTNQAAFNVFNTNATTISAFGAATNIDIGATTGTTSINNSLDVDLDVNIDGGDLTTNQATFNVFNTNATAINAFGAATAIDIGATTGTTSINNNLDVDLDVNIDGGDLTTTLTSFNVFNTSATTINAFGAATAIDIGATTGTTSINNNLDVDLDVNIDGGDLTTNQAAFNIINTNATTLNIGSAATTARLGATSGTLTLGNPTVVGTQATQTLWNTVATTVNAFGAATNIDIGATTGTTSINNNLDVDLDVNIDGGDLTTNQASFNLINTNATTLNIGSAASTARLGATSGTLTIGNPTVVGTQATQNLWNTVATAVNAFGAATAIDIGATTGTTSINNNLDVDLDVNIDGGDLTTNQATFNVFNTNATTINAFGNANKVNVAKIVTATITNVARASNVVTITTSAAHGLAEGDIVKVEATTNTAVNINAVVVATVPTSTTFTYTLVGSNITAVADTGTVTSGRVFVNSFLDVNEGVLIRGGDLVTDQATFNLLERTATTVNAFGTATSINLASVAAASTLTFGSGVTGNTLKISGTAAGTTSLLSDVTTGTFNLLTGTTTGTINVGSNAAGALKVVFNTDTTSNTTGALQVAGGVMVAKDLFVGGGDIITNQTAFNVINTVATTVNAFGAATNIDIGATSGTTSINNNLDVDLDVNIDGGDLTTNQATFNVFNTNATTVNAFGAATSIDIGATSGTTSINNSLDVDLDVNIDGGDLTTNQATFNVFNTNATTINAFKAATNIDIGATSGTTSINNSLDVDLDVNIDGGDLTTNQATFNIINTNATTVNAFGAATSIDIGATSGTTSINNNLDVDLDVNIDGGDLTTSLTSFNLINTNATTLNIGSAASTARLGATSGTLTLGNPTVVGTQVTQTLWNTVATTVNAFGAATNIDIGATTGTTSINHNLDVDLDVNIDGGDLTTNQAAFNIINTNATTLNIGSAATTARLGATSGTLTLGNPTVVGTQATQNLWNTVATSVNAFGAATAIDIGATSGTTSINNNLDVDLDVNIDGGDLTTNQATFNIIDTNATTVNAFGAATTLNLGHDGSTASTTNIATGATASGSTKTVNVGTAGATGSTTNVNIGSANTLTAGTLTVNTNDIQFDGSGNIKLKDSGTTKRGVQGIVGSNDYWFVGGGATATDGGFMEIATSDNGTEPIYVRQYSGGAPTAGGLTTVNSATLLDANGNTVFPKTVTANAFAVPGLAFGTVSATTTSTSQTVLHTAAIADYDGGKYTIQAKRGTLRQITEIMVTHDGTTAIATEYAVLMTGDRLFTVDVDISSTNMRILVTSTAATSTAYRAKFDLLTAP